MKESRSAVKKLIGELKRGAEVERWSSETGSVELECYNKRMGGPERCYPGGVPKFEAVRHSDYADNFA